MKVFRNALMTILSLYLLTALFMNCDKDNGTESKKEPSSLTGKWRLTGIDIGLPTPIVPELLNLGTVIIEIKDDNTFEMSRTLGENTYSNNGTWEATNDLITINLVEGDTILIPGPPALVPLTTPPTEVTLSLPEGTMTTPYSIVGNILDITYMTDLTGDGVADEVKLKFLKI